MSARDQKSIFLDMKIILSFEIFFYFDQKTVSFGKIFRGKVLKGGSENREIFSDSQRFFSDCKVRRARPLTNYIPMWYSTTRI